MTNENQEMNNIHWTYKDYKEEQEQETATVKRPKKLAIDNHLYEKKNIKGNQNSNDENYDNYEKMNLKGNQNANDENKLYANINVKGNQNQTLELPHIIPSMKKT